jgi:carbamoyltransferase
MLAEEANRFMVNHEAGLFAGEFMTVCYDCSAEMKALFPAVVHVDNTARTQFVHRDRNPGLHTILSAYAKHSGAGVLLNTSFNIHEEPIVRTPDEAAKAFVTAGLDCLALGPYFAQRSY